MSSPNPFSDFDPNDLSALQGIITNHGISASDFDTYVNGYFPSGAPPAKKLHVSDVQQMVDSSDCATDKFHIIGSDKTSNQDLTFNQVNYTDKVHPCYSAALLKGAMLIHNPETFEFSKAIVRGVDSVIFRAFDKSGICLYNADLTEAWP
jgi:hypothetical protein